MHVAIEFDEIGDQHKDTLYTFNKRNVIVEFGRHGVWPLEKPRPPIEARSFVCLQDKLPPHSQCYQQFPAASNEAGHFATKNAF